jgi:hypothetical protein
MLRQVLYFPFLFDEYGSAGIVQFKMVFVNGGKKYFVEIIYTAQPRWLALAYRESFRSLTSCKLICFANHVRMS